MATDQSSTTTAPAADVTSLSVPYLQGGRMRVNSSLANQNTVNVQNTATAGGSGGGGGNRPPRREYRPQPPRFGPSYNGSYNYPGMPPFMIANPAVVPVGALGVGVTGQAPPAPTQAPPSTPPPPVPIVPQVYTDPTLLSGAGGAQATVSATATASTSVYWMVGCCCCLLILSVLAWWFLVHKKGAKKVKNGLNMPNMPNMPRNGGKPSW